MGLTIDSRLSRTLVSCECEALGLVRRGAYGAVLSLRRRDTYHIVEASIEPADVATAAERDAALLSQLATDLTRGFGAASEEIL